ncbi:MULTISPECIES: 6-phospho-beta-glucosidase [Bacillus]|uniref:6-phospho-beta-glucosidase n=1 Tax=Bacillus TaxID=1386 RepID=UPI0022447B5B|nr:MULTISPECIES: 6-phospho-beta-glucosidase [Bacillus]MDN5387667.1 6-phospho-beta-glucosidase [Bacillus sp. LB7]MEC1023010.1 6-phospho-beta-glucosidase [Bacillus paralicheniformis]MEC1026758.1 6-phospho-beta-glucosidase [Bacillus paralicheniformis]MEC1035636.1 6-phospho-beta-glucosidase [Bacillus paralicheniformis]MEC1051498.1 6-phospho-beta-glucosidase [Bacillus paralicheniformis]
MALKVVVIGGGSSYTPEIIEGIIKRQHQFPVNEIVLVDIEEGKEKLRIVSELAKRMIRHAGVPIELNHTIDRAEALKGADFVTVQIRVGGLKARALDENIPLSHGLIGQETNGAGGMFKAFRTIPVMLDIARDIQEICPEAWLINFTNPAGIVTEALLKHGPHQKVVGVCNIPYNMKNSIAEIFGVDVSRVMIEFAGLNHFVFGKRVWIDGIDRTEETIEHLLNDHFGYSPSNIAALPWNRQFLRSLRMLPSPYHQYYYQHEEALAKDIEAYNNNGTRAETVMEVERQLFEKYKDAEIHEKPKELEGRGGAYYSESACSLMNSLYHHSMDIQTVNTLNKGSIPDLPDDAVIEVNSVITKSGPIPLTVGKLPAAISGPICLMKKFEQLVIEAAVTGDYNTAYSAMITNPLVSSDHIAQKVLDEMLEAHKRYLPQFFEEVRAHETK